MQIHQERGQRVMKLAVAGRSIVALPVVTPTEIHLGDQVVVETRVEVDSVTRTAPSAPADATSRHTGGSDER